MNYGLQVTAKGTVKAVEGQDPLSAASLPRIQAENGAAIPASAPPQPLTECGPAVLKETPSPAQVHRHKRNRAEWTSLCLVFETTVREARRNLLLQGISRFPTRHELIQLLWQKEAFIGEVTFHKLVKAANKRRLDAGEPAIRVDRAAAERRAKWELVERTYQQYKKDHKTDPSAQELRRLMQGQSAVPSDITRLVHKINQHRIRERLNTLTLKRERHLLMKRADVLSAYQAVLAEKGRKPHLYEVKLRYLREHPGRSFRLRQFQKVVAELRSRGFEIALHGPRKLSRESLGAAVEAARGHLGRNPALGEVLRTLQLHEPALNISRWGVRWALNRFAAGSAEAAEQFEVSGKAVINEIAPAEDFLKPLRSPYLGGLSFITYLKPYDLASPERIRLSWPDYDMQKSALALFLEDAAGAACSAAIRRARQVYQQAPQHPETVLRTLAALVLHQKQGGVYAYATADLRCLFYFLKEKAFPWLSLKQEAAGRMQQVLASLVEFRADRPQPVDPRFYLKPLLERWKIPPSPDTETKTPLRLLDEILYVTLNTRWSISDEQIQLEDPLSPERVDNRAWNFSGKAVDPAF